MSRSRIIVRSVFISLLHYFAWLLLLVFLCAVLLLRGESSSAFRYIGF